MTAVTSTGRHKAKIPNLKLAGEGAGSQGKIYPQESHSKFKKISNLRCNFSRFRASYG